MRSQIVAVIFAAFLLASLSATRADQVPITYTIVDEGAASQGGWSIDGTVTTDGALGQLTQMDFVTATLTLTNPSVGSYTATDAQFSLLNGESYVLATAGALIFSWGTGSWDGCAVSDATGTVDVVWEDSYGNGAFGASANSNLAWLDYWNADGLLNTSTTSTIPPNLPFGQPWVIGTTVPEPASPTLLVSALLGLAGAFYLRRRRAKA
jgi:MYXO-CTERM domain-containing protein